MTGGAEAKGWTYEDLGRLTYAQLRNELFKGGKVRTGPRRITAKGAVQLLADFKAGKWQY